MKKLTLLLLVACAVMIGAPKISKADTITKDDLWGTVDVGGGTTKKGWEVIEDKTGLTASDPRTMIANVIQLVLGFLGIIAVILILIGGFKWMTAGGNEEQVGEAKKWIYSGVIGLLIILASYALANFVLTQLITVTTT
ncbi:hypothetical protein A2Y83_01805 [Candidatus Falkowbacteria bacterium RBG_13_39_14]|uniref:Uncharacterized protein n=1 Tax=Candidatus Falkowbacteria bacterium RBG_13_39_14 TaxID=1797985 RepID=A0A1F5S305_9BACT|nr:MAG: hypothetical protein A2Y83_01805 [Candidatus Falkowbacteria bacterium RBG_13_39_14]